MGDIRQELPVKIAQTVPFLQEHLSTHFDIDCTPEDSSKLSGENASLTLLTRFSIYPKEELLRLRKNTKDSTLLKSLMKDHFSIQVFLKDNYDHHYKLLFGSHGEVLKWTALQSFNLTSEFINLSSAPLLKEGIFKYKNANIYHLASLKPSYV